MVNRIQTLRSSAPGVLPQAGTRQPGELWLNFADFALGFIDAAQTAQKILAVRWFVPTASYAVGDFVLNGGNLYRAIAPSAPGTFVAANWSKVGTAADLTAMQAYVDAGDALRVPLAGGAMTGPLILNADPTAALGATTKQYVDLRSGAVTVSATPPANPNPGALWWDSVGGQLYVWYVDPTTSQWVIAVTALTNLPIASTTVLGGVKVDGTSIQAAGDGTISTTVVPMGDNRVINGDMRIDQRNNGASGSAAGYTVDRWNYANTSGATRGTRQRNLNGIAGPVGFPYYLGFQSSSAYTLAADDGVNFSQAIEADMVGDLAWGTVNARAITLSFWARSSLTGTFSGAIQNWNIARSYPFTYSLPTANAWTFIVVTIPGDITGTWTLTGNNAALGLVFDLGSGANNRGPAGAWVGDGTADGSWYNGVTGAVSVVAVNGATFFVTGVKLEIGSVVTPYNRQSLAKSLADCQRYYQTGQIGFEGYGVTSGVVYTGQSFPVTMRAAPTITTVANNCTNVGGISWGTLTNPVGFGLTLIGQITATGSYVLNQSYTASAEL